MKNLRVNI